MNRNRNAIVIIGSGQHQMWDAQEYDYDWLKGSGLLRWIWGCGFWTSVGAAFGRLDSIVVNLEDDATFIMNVDELATITMIWATLRMSLRYSKIC